MGETLYQGIEVWSVGMQNFDVIAYVAKINSQILYYSEPSVDPEVIVYVYDTSFLSLDLSVRGLDSSLLVSSQEDFSYTYGSTGNNIIWTVESELDAMFDINQDGTFIKSGEVIGTSQVILGVDGLDPGQYTFSLHATDTVGNEADSTVKVVVFDSQLANQGEDTQFAMLLLTIIIPAASIIAASVLVIKIKV